MELLIALKVSAMGRTSCFDIFDLFDPHTSRPPYLHHICSSLYMCPHFRSPHFPPPHTCIISAPASIWADV